jgi:hypothetical protein
VSVVPSQAPSQHWELDVHGEPEGKQHEHRSPVDEHPPPTVRVFTHEPLQHWELDVHGKVSGKQHAPCTHDDTGASPPVHATLEVPQQH